MCLYDNLSRIGELPIKDKNFVNHYLTFRQWRSERTTDPDSHSVGGELLSVGLRQTMKQGQSLETFIGACRRRFSHRIDDDEFSKLLDEMYFENDAQGLFEVSPELLLFKKGSSNSGNTKHVSEVLSAFLATAETKIHPLSKELNFLETEILNEFQTIVTNFEPKQTVANYLPFLADTFARDFYLLCRYPSYLMQNLKAFVALYNFLYSAQLALNINSWKSDPVSKPLFFILDTEKASSERKKVRDTVKELKIKVADLFPILSALEYFNQSDSKTANRYPVWMIHSYMLQQDISVQEELVIQLTKFLTNYRSERGRDPWATDPTTPDEALESIIATAKEIFNQPKSGQQDVMKRVVRAFENEVARHFIQSRGRGGNVLIINQDYLLLLTNLAVGSESKLQFQQLIEEFKSRGVWFDQQSQQALIEFYDRVGNLERMSDSGDAVYVRKTI